MPSSTDSLRSSGVELKTVRYARDGSGIASRMRSISRGRSRIFWVSAPRRRVVRAQHRQPGARMAGRHARQQVQVVVEDQRMHRLRRHVHDVGARVAQADQQEQQAFLVERRAIELAQFVLVEGQRGHDHRRAGLVGRAHQHVPDLVEARLQLLEPAQFLFLGQRGGKWRLRNHSAAPSSSSESTSPVASIASGVVRSCSGHGRPSDSAVRRRRRSRW